MFQSPQSLHLLVRVPVFALTLLALSLLSSCSATTEAPAGNNTKLAPVAAIDFGNVAVGYAHDTTVRLTNTGSDTLAITDQLITGPAFLLVDTALRKIHIAPGGYQDLSIRFRPTAVGAFAAVDSLISNSSQRSSIALRGTGVELVRKIEIPSVFDIGNVGIGGCHDTAILFVNAGNDTLVVAGITTSVPSISIDSVTTRVPPGATGELLLTFCPLALGTVTVNVGITSNATTGSEQFVTVKGTGIRRSPGVGSTYTYGAATIDSSGNPIVSSQRIVAATVFATGLTYNGETGVMQVRETGGREEYAKLQENGDVKLYAQGLPSIDTLHFYGGGWWTLPFATHASNAHLFSGDTDFVSQAKDQVHLHIDDYASYRGDTTFVVSGLVLPSSHVVVTETGTYSTQAGTMYVVIEAHYYFSPLIGFITAQGIFVARVTVVGTNQSHTAGGEGRLLLRYDIR